MIERLSASLDSYPHLRLDTTQQAQARAQQRARLRAADAEAEKRKQPSATLYLEDEKRQTPRTEEDDQHKLVLFEQSSTLDSQQSGDNSTADEVLPALEASVLPHDLQMAQVVQIYNRAARIGRTGETVGTRLNAVA
jgi:hypothetical protein